MWSTRKWLVFGVCLLMLAGLGCLDYLTGYEMGLFVFYSLPVGLGTWYLGRRAGLGISVVAAFTWWIADRMAGQTYSSALVLYWNQAVHSGCFFINVFTISKTRELLDRQRGLVVRLGAAEAELARLRQGAQATHESEELGGCGRERSAQEITSRLQVENLRAAATGAGAPACV